MNINCSFGRTQAWCINICVKFFGSWYTFMVFLNELFSSYLFSWWTMRTWKVLFPNFPSCWISNSLNYLFLSPHPKHFYFRYVISGGIKKNLNFSQTIARGGTGVTRVVVTSVLINMGKVLLMSIYFITNLLFCLYTHTIPSKTSRSVMVHLGKNVFFSHFSILSPSQYPHRPNKNN